MKESLYKFIISAGLLVLGVIIFSLLQHRLVYNHTLGLISKNYVKHSDGNIYQEKTPYTSFSEERFLHWDAAHYKNVRDHSYQANKEFGECAFAFFPFFPWVWKVTGFNAIGISLLNYFLFAISLILLSATFLSPTVAVQKRLIVYTLALLLPGTVAFNIPYTESLFMFTFSLACYCLKKNIKWLFVVFLALFAFTRPAVTIIIASFICTDIYFMFTGRAAFAKPQKVALRILPILLGTFLAMYVQYQYSGQWNKVFLVQQNWGYQDFSIPVKFTDWSEEGHAMSVFSLLGVFLPILYYLGVSFFKNLRVKPLKCTSSEGFERDRQYFFYLSLIYVVGITLFSLFFRGGSLNGLQRYALATPFFYIIFFYLVGQSHLLKKQTKAWLLLALFVGGTLFPLLNGYSRSFSFQDNGFYLFLLCAAYLLFYDTILGKKKIIYTLALFIALLVWKTYLLNMFLSDGWIFT